MTKECRIWDAYRLIVVASLRPRGIKAPTDSVAMIIALVPPSKVSKKCNTSACAASACVLIG